MKAHELHSKSVDELKTTLGQLRKDSFNLRFKLASGELEDKSQIRKIRRDIARIKTIITAKEGAK